MFAVISDRARSLLPASALVGMLVLAIATAACGGTGARAVPSGRVAGAFAVPTVAEAYPAASWMAKIQPPAQGSAIDLTCLDANGDRRLSEADAAELGGLDIPIASGDPCLPPGMRREWFVEDAPASPCVAPDSRELLLVTVGGGGTDLFDRNQGVSAPCLRVVIVGHSHGAVVVTSVLAALEAAYEDRVFGVLLDRSLLYYDHEAVEFPVRAAVLNVFQTNEGWHGEALSTANVVNIDASGEVAPQEPRDGPLPIVAVRHSTLDDATGVQRAVVDQVMLWLGEP